MKAYMFLSFRVSCTRALLLHAAFQGLLSVRRTTSACLPAGMAVADSLLDQKRCGANVHVVKILQICSLVGSVAQSQRSCSQGTEDRPHRCLSRHLSRQRSKNFSSFWAFWRRREGLRSLFQICWATTNQLPHNMNMIVGKLTAVRSSTIQKNVYIHVYRRVYIYIHIYIYIRINVYASTYVQVHKHLYTHMRKYRLADVIFKETLGI